MRNLTDVVSTGEPALLRVAEVARIIGFGRTKTYLMIRTGEIPSIEIDGNIRVPRRSLQAWLDQKINSAAHGNENGASGTGLSNLPDQAISSGGGRTPHEASSSVPARPLRRSRPSI